MALRLFVPVTFWQDHIERCPCDDEKQLAREIRRVGRRVLIEGTAQQIETLRGDAAFYAHPDGPDQTPPNIVRSAKATLAAL